MRDMSNEIDENLFEQIFGHTLVKFADKLINTTNKKENHIIVRNHKKNKDKLLEMDDFNDWVIQSGTIDVIFNFNKTIQLDLV